MLLAMRESRHRLTKKKGRRSAGPSSSTTPYESG
jgi:hypothetical protein